MCVRECVRACMRACVHVYMRACVRTEYKKHYITYVCVYRNISSIELLSLRLHVSARVCVCVRVHGRVCENKDANCIGPIM